MGGRRRYVAIVAASVLVGVQAFTAGAALAATPTTTRILYTPPPTIPVGTPAAFTAKIEPDVSDLTISWYVDGAVATTDLTNPNGVSQVSLTIGVGVHEIKAVLEPSADWEGSESDPFALTVTQDAFFYDGWADVTYPRELGSVAGDGLVTGEMDRPEHLFVEADDGSEYWNISLLNLDESPLGVGTYTSPSEAELWVNGATSCSGPSSLVGSMTIQSLSVNGAGVVQELTASFDFKCTATNPPPTSAHGIIRINSSSPFTSIEIAPQHNASPSIDHSFGTVNVGSTSAPWTVAVTNNGANALDVDGSITGDSAFSIGSGGCEGALAPGASCDLDVTFAPTVGGPTTGRLHVLTPDLGITDRPFTLSATGYTDTTVRLSVDTTDPDQNGTAAYTVTVDPPSAVGWPEIDRTCADSVQFGLPGTVHLVTPPGPCTATASFTGSAGFGSSTSSPVSFTMHTSSSVGLSTSSTTWLEAKPIVISATVYPGNGPQPDSGTLTITDLSTATVLASRSIAPGDASVGLTTSALMPGLHELKATYSGGGGIRGSSATVSQTIVDDATPPVGSVSVPPATASTVVSAGLTATDLPENVVTAAALSNDGTHWATIPYTASLSWDLANPVTGGTSAEGTHRLYARFRDRSGNWSAVVNRPVILDRVAPTGTISIAGGAAWTKAAAVTIATPSNGTGSAVSHVALSNDAGAHWTTRPYSASQAWTLPPTNGTRTVWVKWKDAAGNWSAVQTDTIILDTVAPTATGPTWKIGPAGSTLVSGAIPVSLAWTGSDATSGIDHYLLSQSTDGGAYASVSSSVTATTLTRNLAPGHTYRFAIRAVDRAGNVGALYYGFTFRLTGLQQSSAAVHYIGTWPTSTSTTWWGGTAKGSSQAGATASLTFTGRSFAWISLKAPSRGQARIYVNGVLTATVDLYAATLQKQRVGWSGTWSTSATRTVLIKVVGTATRPRIDVDGFFTGS